MQLPEEMPLELNSKILSVVHGCECEDCHSLLTAHYKMIAYYFNNLPVDWRPVSEKPEDEGQIVWVTDGDFVEIASYSSTGFLASILLDSNITHWAYVESETPEPPKE